MRVKALMVGVFSAIGLLSSAGGALAQQMQQDIPEGFNQEGERMCYPEYIDHRLTMVCTTYYYNYWTREGIVVREVMPGQVV